MSSLSRRFSRTAIFFAVLFSAAALCATPANSAETAGQKKVDAAQLHVITIAGMAFVPASVHARVGDTVQFQNKDIVPHTATSRVPGGFDSGTIKPGETWTVVLKALGTFHFACQFHTEMAGEIVVEK